MPRRPRKAAKGAAPAKKGNSSIKKWKSKSDVIPFLDDEDSFHAARDADGDMAGDGDEESEEEEVFALDGLSEDDDEDQEEEDIADEDEDIPPTAPSKSKSKKSSKQPSPPPSDKNSDSESEDEGWGSKKSTYYSTNHTRDEEDFELEAAEALRIQRKAVEAVDESRGDFGLPSATDTIVDTALPGDEVKENVDDRTEVIDSESIALARDWSDTVKNMTALEAKLSTMDPKDPGTPMMHLYHQTMLTYTTTLAFYFYTRSSPKPPPASLKNQILERLLTLKRSLSTLEELDLESSMSGGSEGEEDWELDLGDEDDIEAIANKLGLSVEEAKEMYDQALLSEGSDAGSGSGSDEEEEEETVALPPPSPKKKEKSKKAKAPVFDLVEPTFTSSSTSTRSARKPEDDAYGENTQLSAADTTDKKSRKKDLRFYTSRIESQSKRRAAIAQERRDGGGDDDLPYTARTKKVVQRKHEKPDVLDGEDGKKRKRTEDDEEEQEQAEDGYYELISKKAKAAKKQKADSYISIHEPIPLPTSASSGPRNLTSAILNNRGLTPNRPKNIRNPRVKKRMRFEAAKKKVGSQKAVYSGGLKDSKGVYGGEKSGISRVVKSVKLG